MTIPSTKHVVVLTSLELLALNETAACMLARRDNCNVIWQDLLKAKIKLENALTNRDDD